MEELHEMDQRSPAILVAVDHRVYDVSSSPSYRKGGSYAKLAGRDCGRSLATHNIALLSRLNPDELQSWDDLTDLSSQERAALNDWIEFFDRKYPRVGTLVQTKSYAGSDQEDPDAELPTKGVFLTQSEPIDFFNL